jgi:hypothetical protein
MEPINDLFPVADVGASPSRDLRWQFVTNQRNLFYILAAGLIMPPAGFGKKYYLDTLAAFPGWIPVFSGSIPRAAVDFSVSEKSHLKACIVSLDLSAINGKVIAIRGDGTTNDIQFPSDLDGTEQLILVPAPLPISCISSIGFRTREEKSSCEVDARDFDNVPLTDFKREVIGKSFSEGVSKVWPPIGVNVDDRRPDLNISLAAGGMMAMLFKMADRGEIALAACQAVFDAEESSSLQILDPMLSALRVWLKAGHLPQDSDVLKTLFWGAVEKVASSRSLEVPISPQDIALAHLDDSSDLLDDRMKVALSKLSGELRTLAGFSDSTITEIFERHPKPFSRVMMLFFLRAKCVDLIEFKHPLLTEADFVAAAILFGAREGWLGLPMELRNFPTLQAAVCHRMAALSHRISDTGLSLGAPPIRPLPLREVLAAGPKGWSAPQKEAAQLIAKEGKWDCIQTRVTLGKGDYRISVDGAGLHILIAGEAKAVMTEVDREKFFASLAVEAIPLKLDRKVRELFKGQV